MPRFVQKDNTVYMGVIEDKLYFSGMSFSLEPNGDTLLIASYRLKDENTPRIWIDGYADRRVNLVFRPGSNGAVYSTGNIPIVLGDHNV
jgi:hypothetical protein